MVLKHSPNHKSESKKPLNLREKSTKKVDHKVKKSITSKNPKKPLETKQSINDNKDATIQVVESLKSLRPEDEVVTYNEIDFELREIVSEENHNQVLIGPLRLTRFERARITGARSLQLSLGAPSLIRIPNDVRDSISLAVAELDLKALPISIRRILPNGMYQDIPIDWMK
ncbi:MAG TPA: DNA-directed RNA polymerase subunit K [Nitrososphaeraceae archaeon]|nr:DNA-directed RNA polymerase subunit K [Nitrososphaeraceae archaeon]